MGLPDQSERIRALTDHDSTLLVEAGAGSGKTALMAGRVVALLAAGVVPRRVAAITFTELAAGELFTRICEYLDALLEDTVPEELVLAFENGVEDGQREYLRSARQSIGEMTATTIHGFCQQLIRPYPVEANVDPGAQIVDEVEAQIIWDDLLQRFLRRRLEVDHDTSPLAAFVLANDSQAEWYINELATFLRRHRTARAAAVAYDPTLLGNLLNAVENLVTWLDAQDVTEETTVEVTREIAAWAESYQEALGNGGSAAVLIRLATDFPLCSAHTQRLTWRKWGRKTKWKKAAQSVGRSLAEGERLSDEGMARYDAVGNAWETLQTTIGAAAFSFLSGEFDELLEDYAAYKRDAALLDFDDLLLKARDLLRSDEQVRQALAERYQVVHIDEFQDTDPIQAEILWRLCGEGGQDTPWQERQLRPGALFCVGDPKQAIYRFRGADVDTYLRAREAIREQYPKNILEVTANFRSFRPILEWVNQRFKEPLSTSGQPGFQNLEATREPNSYGPRVVALDVSVSGDRPRVNDIRECEARAVAELCRRLIGSYRIQGREENPLARAGDIALLAPAGTQLWRYERAMEWLGIPVSSLAGKGFFRRQEIQDLIAIARTLADARDTVAFGALLRGPLLGLTEEQLLDIVDALPALDNSNRLPRLMLWTEPDEIRNELARDVVRKLQGLARRARGTTPFELLAEAVEELRVRPILAQRHPGGAERVLANVDLFLEMARPYQVRGLHSFAVAMRQKWEDAESQVEGRPDAEEQAVHLITMHSAKGLEWPIVIPVNTVTAPRTPSSILHDRTSDEIYHQLGPIRHVGYETVLAEEAAQEARENIRLLYVACTRSKELLVLPRLSAGNSSWLEMIDLGLGALPVLDVEGLDDELPPASVDPDNRQDRPRFESEATEIAAATRIIEWHRPSRHEQSDMDVAAEQAESTAFVEGDVPGPSVLGGPARGMLLHKLMEEVLTGETQSEAGLLEARANELLAQLGKQPTDDPNLGISPKELAKTVNRTLALERIADFGGSLEPEFSIYQHTRLGGPDREVATSGVADAVALDEAGKIRWVIDWKSDVEPRPKQRERYRGQLRDYLAATEADAGLIVYMTLGQVEEVRVMSAGLAE